MPLNAFDRTTALVGERGISKLSDAKVLVVGLGGVGGAAAEILVRSCIGNITFVDGDGFEPTNLNRQLLCTVGSLGENKAVAAAKRAAEINPDIVTAYIDGFVTESNVDTILDRGYDYCADCIDDLKNKVLLIEACVRRGLPVVSAMGAGNRIGCDFAVTDVYCTHDDPFAKKLRRELKSAGIVSLDVVCAQSPPLVRTASPSSIAAPPTVMGAMLANHIVRKIIGI